MTLGGITESSALLWQVSEIRSRQIHVMKQGNIGWWWPAKSGASVVACLALIRPISGASSGRVFG